MTYCFRYRVKIGDRLSLGDEPSATLNLPEMPPIAVTFDETDPLERWAVFKSCGFDTKELADSAGLLFGKALLISGSVGMLGIDLGHRSTLQFSDQIHGAIWKQTGRALRSELHGLMTYEENSISVVGIRGRARVTLSIGNLQNLLEEWHICAAHLNDRQRTCAALINDSLFVHHTEAKLVLCISAVEALCDQGQLGEAYQSTIESLEGFANSLVMDEALSKTIRSMLSRAKRESIRYAYLSKIEKLLSREDSKAFDALYGKRSALLHDGEGRGDLQAESGEALEFAIKLLSAELKQQLQE